MPGSWVVDDAHPEGRYVAFDAAQLAQYEQDQAEGAARATLEATLDANATHIRDGLRQHLHDALDLATLVQSGQATAQQQRDALALCLRGTVRLARLVLSELDEAP